MGDPSQATAEPSLSDIIANTAMVMAQMEKGLLQVEDTVSAVLTGKNDVSLSDTLALQRLDLVLQTTQEIALLLGRLAKQTAKDRPFVADEILAPIKLAAVRAMIAHDPMSSPRPIDHPEKSTVHLF